MTITARYASTCVTCQQRIQAGELIEWSKGAAVTHTSCPAQVVAPVTSAAPAPYKRPCLRCGKAVRDGANTDRDGSHKNGNVCRAEAEMTARATPVSRTYGYARCLGCGGPTSAGESYCDGCI